MIDMNIKFFRKSKNMTQLQLAEELNVARQTVAKWENGEVTPNINDCIKMSELFDISMDDLVKDIPEDKIQLVPPRKKHLFGFVTVGERGQIVIPKEAREIFDIKSGEKLLILGDEDQGLAIVKADAFHSFAKGILKSMAAKEKE